jgi:hypothetical protein
VFEVTRNSGRKRIVKEYVKGLFWLDASLSAEMRKDQIPVRYNNFNEPVKNNEEIKRYENERYNENLTFTSNEVDNNNHVNENEAAGEKGIENENR